MSDFIAHRPQFQIPENFQLRIGNRLIDLSRPKVVGIINLNTDSFYEKTRFTETESVLQIAGKMLSDGADFLDLGAVSTRPGASEVLEQMELDRLIPIVQKLKSEFPEVVLSIDTFRSAVAKNAVQEGADMVNDIGGGRFDPNMLETIASLNVPLILMHNRGNFTSMHQPNAYQHITVEVIAELQAQIVKARLVGISDIIVDPGFGFSKSSEQNFSLLRKLSDLQILNCPILIGISRKSMIYKTLQTSVDESLNGTTALHMAALMQGAHILRVHDVKQAKETIQLFEKLCLQES